MNRAAYLAKCADDEVARRQVEASNGPPRDGREEPIVALSRTMDAWLTATDVELLDGPDVFSFDEWEE